MASNGLTRKSERSTTSCDSPMRSDLHDSLSLGDRDACVRLESPRKKPVAWILGLQTALCSDVLAT